MKSWIRCVLPAAVAVCAAAHAFAQEPPPAAGADGTRLVVVTFERRVGPRFGTDQQAYGDSLRRWRCEVLEVLFGPPQPRGCGAAGGGGEAPLLRPGDHLALFADGASAGFASSAAMARATGGRAVAAALVGMLELPGGDGTRRFWSYRNTEGAGAGRLRVDSAVRALVTCPLVGLAEGCGDERGRTPGAATRGFSRPLLTFPVQYGLVASALGQALPDSVYWVWVQAGERVNDTNGTAAEIVRDFGRQGGGDAVARYHGQAVAAFSFHFMRRVGGEGGNGAGVTVWKVTSARLERMMNPAVTLPLAVQERRGRDWVALDTALDAGTAFYRRMRGWLEGGPLRLALDAPPGHDAAELRRVEASVVCEEDGRARRRVPLDFVVGAGGRTAALSPESRDRLSKAAARCLPGQGLASRLGRELARDRRAVQLRLEVRAQVGPRSAGGELAAPPVLSTLSLTRGWRQELLHPLEAFFLLLLAVGAAASVVLGVRHLRSPTRLDLEVVTEAGEPVTAGTVVELVPGAGEVPRLRLRAVRGAGPARRGRVELAVAGRGLQSEVPVAPGADAARVVVARDVRDGSEQPRLSGVLERGGADAGALALYVPDDVADVDRIPVGVPLRAGIELRVQGTCSHPRVQVPARTFYVPCAVRLQHVPVRQPPRVLLRPYQRYVYRGLRLDAVRRAEDRPVTLGVVRLLHRAEPGVVARPYPVAVELSVRAQLESPDGHPRGVLRAALVPGEGATPAVRVVLRLDEAQRDLPLYLWPDAALPGGDESGRVAVSVEGSWRELRTDAAGPPYPLQAAREEVALYPAAEIDGIALDFGTSATRLAFLQDGRPPDNVMAVAVPDRLIPAREEARVRWVAELESEVAIDATGRVRAAGADAHLEAEEGDGASAREVEVLPSLKLALLAEPESEPVWAATREVIDALGEIVERPRRSEAEGIPLLRYADGAWRTQMLPVGPQFRYLLLVTVPDAFTREQQERLAACFGRWRGSVDVLPLREAEAVVYGFLRRAEDRRPERTLVVDVGAGTVDFAAVRAEFHDGQMLEVRVEGLAVSRAAGNAYDQAIDRSLGGTGTLSRRLRETKEQRYAEPEASGGELTPEAEAFLSHPQAAAYFEEAVHTPLEALLGRLALQKGWQPVRFDQVILSGRGSLAAGWKPALVEALRARKLVPEGVEAAWLHWLGAAPSGPAAAQLRYRAGRLKAAVVEGALALVTYDQTRIQTSRDILRDHLVLVAQEGPARFVSRLLVPAGEPVPGAGLTVTVPVGDWIDARLVLSSHPPQEALDAPGNPARGASAGTLWRNSVRDGGDGAALPEARVVGGRIRLEDRPGDAARLRVSVARGGVVRWDWVTPAEPEEEHA